MPTQRGSVTLRTAMSRTLLCSMLVACKAAVPDEPRPAVASTPNVPAASSLRSATRSSAGDSMSELPVGIHTQTFLLGDTTVRYTILVPEGYSLDVPVPLIVMLHYGGYDGDVPPFYGR